MSRPSQAATSVSVHQARAVREDWRLERMRSLVDSSGLADGDWDPERLLLVARPGGRLIRLEQCLVADCPIGRHGAGPLCRSHVRQLDRSGAASIEEWLAAGGPHRVRRRSSPQSCTVTGDDGVRCPRPPSDTSRLCRAHVAAWDRSRQEGAAFEEFLASARPLDGFGACVVASCFLESAYKRTRLCGGHYCAWRRQGCPEGRGFEAWAAQAAQPSNARVLSLGGLPELVRLELLYGVARRVAEHIDTRTGEVSTLADQLRAAAVASVTDFDLASFRGNETYAHFAAFVVDRVGLAYAEPELERHADVWDLRVFGRCGHLDFTGIRQDWLRETTKAWAAAAAAGVVSASTLQHRVHALVALSSVLASGPGGGHDPAALGRADIDRFLVRRGSLRTKRGRPYGTRRAAAIIEGCAVVLREARELGELATLPSTFSFRRGDPGPRVDHDEPGRALPDHVVACLDAQRDMLRGVPGYLRGTTRRGVGVLGERAGEMAVLIYKLLK
ncbi:MAG: hypothetical protein ACRD0Q_02225, partial [Acidimicrobiales bacterium]